MKDSVVSGATPYKEPFRGGVHYREVALLLL